MQRMTAVFLAIALGGLWVMQARGGDFHVVD
jgi:hypothetical protein